MNIQSSFNPIQFKARVQAKKEDFKGVWNQATQGANAAVETVGSAFTSQASGANSSGIVPGVVAGAESAGVGAGVAANAAANPSVAGLATTGGATAAGTTVGATGLGIDQSSGLDDNKTEGPLESAVSAGGSGVGVVESGFSSEGASGVNSSNIVPNAVNVAPSVPLVNEGAAAWSGANPSAAALATSAGVALPIAAAKTVAKLGDRVIMPN